MAAMEAPRGPSVLTDRRPVSSIGKKPFGIVTAIQPAAAMEAMKAIQTRKRRRSARSSNQP